MSLVSEALRKARAERERRQVEAGSLPPALAPAPRPASHRLLPYLLVASVLSGLAGAALVTLLARPRGPTPPEPRAAVVPNTRAEPVVAVPEPEVPANPEKAFLPSPVSAAPASAPAAPREPSPAPEAVAPPPTPTPAETVELVLQGTVSGVEFTLEYLVYGTNRSFARINGQEVTPGDSVAGFAVDRILEDRVVLRRGTQTVVLKVR